MRKGKVNKVNGLGKGDELEAGQGEVIRSVNRLGEVDTDKVLKHVNLRVLDKTQRGRKLHLGLKWQSNRKEWMSEV